jgi:ammonium transporter, Amt family
MKTYRRVALALVLLAALTPAAWAADATPDAAPATTGTAAAPADPWAGLNAGDTAWLLASAALVLIMTPGLAFFYGGMVRKKNVLSVLMQCTIIMCLVSVQWVVIGYSIGFAPGNSLFGSLDYALLGNMGNLAPAAYGSSVPHLAYMIFQAMFAIITPALIIGAFAERMKFAGFLAFILLWSTFVYDPVAHWVWGDGGWLRTLGALDFAGGTVVHINAGVAGLVVCLLMGRRKGYDKRTNPPHNVPFIVLGAGLLWFGWFGFNAGSAVAANGLAASAFVVTNTAAAMAGLTWALLEWLINGKPTMFGTVTGAVAGLVAITPASGFVSVGPAILIGIGVSVVCFLGVAFVKPRLGYDDSLDAFGVHGIGGMWGAIATGLFASTAVNSAGANGLFYGNPGLLVNQLIAVGATIAYSAVGTLVIYKVLDATIGMRVTEKEEVLGLDLTQHREAAYTLIE